MWLKGIFCLCIQSVLLGPVFTQCIPPTPYPCEHLWAADSPIIEGYDLASVVPLEPFYGRVIGGNIIVDTLAPHAFIGPAGVTIFSDDLIIEGAVLVSGTLPFVGTVGLEGIVPTTGSSGVLYECGNSNIGIVDIQGAVTEVVIPVGSTGTLGYNGLRL